MGKTSRCDAVLIESQYIHVCDANQSICSKANAKKLRFFSFKVRFDDRKRTKSFRSLTTIWALQLRHVLQWTRKTWSKRGTSPIHDVSKNLQVYDSSVCVQGCKKMRIIFRAAKTTVPQCDLGQCRFASCKKARQNIQSAVRGCMRTKAGTSSFIRTSRAPMVLSKKRTTWFRLG
jgi:hypothetical protein